MRYIQDMVKKAAPILLLCLSAAGCMGTSPAIGHDPDRGLSSVLIGARFMLPSGQTRSGVAWINLEGEGEHADGEVYRLAVDPGLPMLYQIEPDAYRLAPTRGIFGGPQATLKARIEDRTYYAPFPRDVMRKAAVDFKPGKIVSLGVLEIRLTNSLPGRPATVKAFLDDSLQARRKLVEEAVRAIMDPTAPLAYRENAVVWSKALDMTLVGLTSESEAAPLYKRASP